MKSINQIIRGNKMKFKNRELEKIIPEADYYTVMTARDVNTKTGPAVVIDFKITEGPYKNVIKTRFFYDSSDTKEAKLRHNLFDSIGHKEWFDKEDFNPAQLNGLVARPLLSKYVGNDGVERNGFRAFLPVLEQPAPTPLIEEAFKGGGDDIPF
jgi:hypothetical protein